MKIIDIAIKHLGESEATALFTRQHPIQTYFWAEPGYKQDAVEAARPSAGFNLLFVCKDYDLESLDIDELRTMTNHLVRRPATYPELTDKKYEGMLNELNNEVYSAFEKVKAKSHVDEPQDTKRSSCVLL